MNTIRNITMVSTILSAALFASLTPTAAQTYNPDCGHPVTNPTSALVWDMDSETYVARIVDIGRADVVPTAFKAPGAPTGYDPNIAFDESLIGAGSAGTAKTLSLDSGS